jgi:hypothetical protein
VKGATNDDHGRWWVQYGYCNDEVIAGADRPQSPLHSRRAGNGRKPGLYSMKDVLGL